jgi:tetratricopeptide (TPR) repeat protein
MLHKKGVHFFYISDDTFTLKKQLVIQICKMILKRNLRITWAAISHVNHISEEMLFWMRLAGCTQISYGVESGSEKIRTRLCKNIQTDAIEKAFSITVKYGILARAYFIYGSPGETWETIGESIELIKRIKPLGVIFYILDLFPGTALYDEFQQKFHLNDDIWLNRIEDILYFENDPELSREMILEFGEKLRTGFYKNLHRFANDISLVDRKELTEKHADFYSRLAMTFSHGDYAGIDAVENKEETAEKLYRKSLDYAPNHRAFLGLGILKQKNEKFRDAAEILTKGLEYFPDSEPISTCLGVTYMNLHEHRKALPLFLKFPESEQSARYASDCYRAMESSNRADTNAI